MTRKLRALTAAAIASLALSSCASINVDDMPQPGKTYSDGYDVVLEFANVLNLPERAKVVMDGTTVGVVESMAVTPSAVDVTARIEHGITIPAGSRAMLQQATVLGDIYVALERAPEPTAGAQMLAPDGRIPLAQTTSPPQLEDTIANMAAFVTSGSIQRIQDSIIRVNNVTPQQLDEVRAISSRVSMNLQDLSRNVDTVDLWLNGVADTAGVISANTPKLNYWFSPAGMTQWDRMAETGIAIGTLVPSVGSIYTGGYWLVPFLNSLGIALDKVQKSKWAVEGEYRPWRQLFTDVFLPQDRYPAMNITSVQTSDGREISGNVEDVLRMLGAMP